MVKNLIAKIRNRPLILLVVVFLLFRLTNLTLLPVFTDEANYLNWGWISVRFDPFYPLVDAKQPGLMWLFGLSQHIFPDPLWAGRFISVLFGLMNLILLYAIAKKLHFSALAAFITSLLYILCPLFLFYDRQALMESSLVTSSLSVFLLLLSLAEKLSLKTAAALFTLLSIGFWIKTSALLFLVSAVAAILALGLSFRRRLPQYLTHLLLCLCLFLVLILPLVFQSGFVSNWYRNSGYSLTLSEMLKFPFDTWLATVRVNLQLWFILLTPPLFLASLYGLYLLFTSGRPGAVKLVSFIWLFLPLVLYLFSAKFSGPLFQRYTTPFLPLLLLFAGLGFHRLPRIFLLSLAIPLFFSLSQVTNPPEYFRLVSRFTRYSYIEGYITGFDTGYQVNAIMDYLRDKSSSGPVMVGLQLFNFNPTAGVYVYSRRLPNLYPAYVGSYLPGYENYNCLSAPTPFYLVAVTDDLQDLGRFVESAAVITNPYDSGKHTVYTLKTGCPPEKTAPLPYFTR